MKKFLFALLLLSASFNLYLVNVEVVVKDELDAENAPESFHSQSDHITLAQAALKKSGQVDCAPKVIEKVVEKIVYRDAKKKSEKRASDHYEDLSSLSKEEVEKLSFKYHQDWSKKSKKFFEYGLGLSDSQQRDYERIKLDMDEEINSMLYENSTESEASAGKVLSSQEMIRMGQIHKKYENKLRRAFGPAAYQEYLSFRKAYNEKLARENRGAFSVSF